MSHHTTRLGNTHFRRLFKEMHQQYKDGRLTDFTIKASGTDIACHRLVLGAAFPYFTAMFEMASLLASEECSSADLSFLDVDALHKLLDLAYTGEISFTTDNIEPLVKAAGYLQVEDVTNECDKHLVEVVNRHNCMKWYVFGSKYSLPKLVKKSHKLVLKYFSKVIHAESFKELHVQNVIDLLQDDSLNVHSEKLVVDAVVMWLSHSLEKREICLPELLNHIRFHHCTTDVLEALTEDSNYNVISCIRFRSFVRNILRQRDVTNQRCHRRRSSLPMSLTLPPRHAFTSNKLLILGGRAAESDVKAANVRDCMQWCRTEQSWSKFTELPPHYSQCHQWSVHAVDGRIFVVGGYHKDEQTGLLEGCAEAWMWSDHRWRALPSLAQGRWAQGLIYASNTLFCFGGKSRKESIHANHLKHNEYLPLDEEETDAQWLYTTGMKFKFFSPLVAVVGDNIYLLGMMGCPNRYISQVYEYHIPSHRVSGRALLPSRCVGGAALTVGEDIYVVGGDQAVCLRYTPSTDTFTDLLPPALSGPVSSLLYIDARLLIGRSGRGRRQTRLDEYAPQDNTWHSSDLTLPSIYDGKDVCLANVEVNTE